MTNYVDHDSCYLCGSVKSGRAGQVGITNLVHDTETEVEEVDDERNQGDTVTVTDSRGGSQTCGRARGHGCG
jgi:hypothetical protein